MTAQSKRCRPALAALAGAMMCAAGMTAASGPAAAQGYPTKPIRVILALSAGSAADIVPRLVFDHVGQALGQSVILENRPGAGGSLAANAVAKADPDGYTLLAHSNAHVIAPSVIAKLPYDVIEDFAGVALLGIVPNVLVIATEQNIKTLPDFIKAAKARPNGITYGAVVGSATHLNAEHFRNTMKVEARMVPFKGAPEALTEVLAARVDIYFSPILPALPFIDDKKMVALMVSAAKRVSALPDVPTGIEQGYPGSVFGLWIGAYAPAKTPRDIVARLNAEVAKAMQKPEVQARLKQMGVEQNPMSPQQFDAFTKAEVATNAELAKMAGLSKQ